MLPVCRVIPSSTTVSCHISWLDPAVGIITRLAKLTVNPEAARTYGRRGFRSQIDQDDQGNQGTERRNSNEIVELQLLMRCQGNPHRISNLFLSVRPELQDSGVVGQLYDPCSQGLATRVHDDRNIEFLAWITRTSGHLSQHPSAASAWSGHCALQDHLLGL